jgi:hypothetical protein
MTGEMGQRDHLHRNNFLGAHVRYGSKATISGYPRDVRFTPNSDRLLRCREMTLCAKSRHYAVQQKSASTFKQSLD